MKYSLAKALAEAGYPQPEAPRYPQRWSVKFGPKSKSTIKINDDMTRRTVVDLRSYGKAFYVPTVDEMLKTLNALHGGSEEFNLSYFDGMATCTWGPWEGAPFCQKWGHNAKHVLALVWIDLSSEKTPHLREELIRVTALAQAGHSFTDRADEINKDMLSFKLKNESNDGKGK